jgi:hypothetical protein
MAIYLFLCGERLRAENPGEPGNSMERLAAQF